MWAQYGGRRERINESGMCLCLGRLLVRDGGFLQLCLWSIYNDYTNICLPILLSDLILAMAPAAGFVLGNGRGGWPLS